MKLVKPVIGGIIGTLVMTAFSSYIFRKNKKFIEPILLGGMLTNETKYHKRNIYNPSSLIIGSAMHLAVGIAFAILYQWLWERRLGKPDGKFTLISGTISGVVGITGWSIFIAAHNHPPKISLRRFLPQLLPAHVIFAIFTVATYNLLHRNDLVKPHE